MEVHHGGPSSDNPELSEIPAIAEIPDVPDIPDMPENPEIPAIPELPHRFYVRFPSFFERTPRHRFDSLREGPNLRFC